MSTHGKPTRRERVIAFLASPTGLAAMSVAAMLLFVELDAEARPGGGQSYGGSRSSGSSGGSRSSGSSSGSRSSGGSSSGGSSSGGSSGGGSGVLQLIILLCIEHPALGIPLLVVFIFVVLYQRSRASSETSWSAGAGSSYEGSVHVPEPQAPAMDLIEHRLPAKPAALQQIDPTFSVPVLEDYFGALFVEAHRARGAGRLGALSAYLSQEATAQLASMAPQGPVDHIVIGSLTWIDVTGADGQSATSALTCEVESNYSEGNARFYARERWMMTRAATAKSRTPDKARVLGCPNCGAPQEQVLAGTCRHCNQYVQSGAFDWLVRSVAVFERSPQPPGLGHYAEERGTHDPTKYQHGVRERWQELAVRDPGTTWPTLSARVNAIFVTFNTAWSARDLASMRPFLTDALFATQQYWIEAYRAQGLRNIIEQAQITRTELVKVESDAFFDALTLRVFAQCIDYTVNEAGKHVSGNRQVPRQYTEYWTFIRGRERKGPARADKQCPSCGAPLAVDMVGTCTYCRVKVTGGTFDWTLSRIEQDEAYVG